MQFGLTETQQTLKNTVRKFLSAECPMAEVRRLLETDTAFDAGLWSKMAEQGWTGIIFPEAYGGFGMGMVEMAAGARRKRLSQARASERDLSRRGEGHRRPT
jgi:hypothetical protein